MASKFSKNQTVIYKDSEGYQKGTVITVLGEDRYEIQPSHIPYAMTRKMWDEELMSEAEYEAMTTPTPTANTETVSAKAVKLSAAVEKLMRHYMNGRGEQYLPKRTRSETWFQLLRSGMINYKATGLNIGTGIVTLTPTGRAYAIAHGWLTAPANSEPQADVFSGDIPAIGDYIVSDDGEVAKVIAVHENSINVEYRNGENGVVIIPTPNVLDVPASDEISKQDAQPEGGFEVGDVVRRKHVKTQATGVIVETDAASSLVRFGNALKAKRLFNGLLELVSRAAIAQTAPVDGGSDERTATLMKGEIVRGVRYLRSGWFRYDTNGGYADAYITDFQSQGELIDAIIAERTERQQAEIRTLESKLAAAVAALEVAKKALNPFYVDWVQWVEAYADNEDLGMRDFINNYEPELFMDSLEEAHKAYTTASAALKLAAREQSGAGEG